MMRNYLYKKIVLLVFLFAGFSLAGQPFRKSRSITKSFKIGTETEIHVNNKYGNIQLITWEKDSVKFEIKIDVMAKKESKANANLERIDVNFVASEYYVEVTTSFAGQGSFWTDVKDKTGNVFAGENRTQINYKIYIPSTQSLEIENKYGNVFTSDYDGTISIKLSNGDIKSHAFYGKTSIDLQYGYANIKFIENGNLNLNYHSELDLDESKNLKIDSRSSRISIDKVDDLITDSNKDKYHLEEVNTLNAKTSFSYFEIQHLGKQLTISGKYGDLDIKNLDDKVTNINFTFENTDISIDKTADQIFDVELIYNEDAELYFSDEIKNKSTTKENEEEKLVKTTGILGSGNSPSIRIKGSIKSGTLRINDN
jgi:hypothetical protein